MNAVLVILTHSCLTPCGELLLGSLHDRLCLCDWQESKRHAAALGANVLSIFAPCHRVIGGGAWRPAR